MALIVLGAYVVFLVLAFGVRTLVHYGRTGATGFHGVSGSPGSLEWVGGVLFVAAILGGIAAPLLDMCGVVPPLLAFHPLPSIGIVLYLIGLSGTLWAQFTMGNSWRVGVDKSEQTPLIVDGPFRWVRNPVFSFMAVAAGGLALLLPNAVALSAFVALVVAVEIQVRAVEEPYLVRVHDGRYVMWAGQRGRFVPGVGRKILANRESITESSGK